MFLRRAFAAGIALLAGAGCSEIIGNLDRVIAIQISDGLSRSVEEGDTITLTATALDASGDSVPDAEIVWAVIDTGQIGLALDSISGRAAGLFPAVVRVQARVEGLRAGPVSVTVTPAPDSLAAAGDTIVSTPVTATTSPGMLVQLFDLTTNPGTPASLAGKPVEFRLSGGATGSVFLSVGDTLPVGDGTSIEATTSGTGLASASLRKSSTGTPPDTVFIEAHATTAAGATVAGSPIHFMVLFEN